MGIIEQQQTSSAIAVAKKQPVWPAAKKFTSGFFRVMYVQIVQSFTVYGMLLILRICIATSLPIIIAVASERYKAEQTDAVNHEISLSALVAVFVSIAWSTISGIQDRTTLDKNRIAYLRFGKQAIAVGKVTGSSVQFTMQLFCAYATVLIIAAAGGFDVSGQQPGRIILYFISATFYYAMVQTGMRYATAAYEKRLHRLLALGGWSLITTVYYIVIAVANLTETTTLAFFADNSKWICLIPFVNAGLIDVFGGNLAAGLPGGGNADFWNQVWPVLIMALECVIICAVVWKPFAAKLKTYLTI